MIPLFLFFPPLAFLVIFFVWSFVFAYKRKDLVSKSYLMFSGFCAAWSGLELMYYFPAFYGHERIISMMIVPFWTQTGILFLYFSYSLIKKKPDWVFKLFLLFSMLAFALAYIPDFFFIKIVRYSWGIGDIRNPIGHSIVSTPTTLAAAYGLFLISKKLRSSKDPEQRSIFKLLLMGGVISLSTVFMLNIFFPNFLPLPSIPRYGSFATSVFAILIFVAVRKNRFLTISVAQVAEDLFDDMHDGVILLREGHTVQKINKSAVSMLNIEDKNVEGVHIESLFSGKPIMSGPESRDLELVHKGNVKHITLLRHTSKRRGLARNKIIILHNVTEQRRAQNILRTSRDTLEKEVHQRTTELLQAQRLEALVTLSGGIAHDFNNLLASIMGYITVAQDDLSKTHPTQEDLLEVLKATKRARDIVQQLLSLSAKSDPKPRYINPSLLVAEAVKMLQISQPKNITMTVTDEEKNRVNTVYVDPSRLHQVLLNIITNAYHAMAQAGGSLNITVRSLGVDKNFSVQNSPLLPGDHIAVLISDTGTGITKENILKIFDPFFTTKKEDAGTGLGLATAIRIIQEYNGTIVVDSKEGVGTTFTIFLPSYNRSLTRDPESGFIAIDRGTEHILLVDDNIQVLKVTRRILEPLGYKVTACINPLEALNLFKRSPSSFDILITDLAMPEMNGLSLGREILSIQPDLPLILISGNLSLRDKKQAKEIGFGMTLSKPLSKAAMAKATRSLLNSKKRSK